MSDLGMAVESIDHIGEGLDGIVVVQVLDLRPHPNADKIQLVDVDTGDGEPLQICCGAFNMAVGDLVPLATLGTVMPGGLEIARRKLRGEWSNGMLCSGRELGLGDDHAGIMIVAAAGESGPALGTPIGEALGITPDVLYDLEINPNRPDAMSVAGVARDLAARLGLPFAIPEPQVEIVAGDAAARISVEILDPDLCGRFHARVIDGVRVEPSPAWIAERLTHLGHAPDQQRGRRLQLRDARAGPAQPHLRPGQAPRRRPAGALGPGRRDASSPSTTSSAPSPAAATA